MKENNKDVRQVQTALSLTEIEEIRKSHMLNSYFNSIDTAVFLEANQKEIELLEKSIKSKPSVVNKHGMRLFQVLPRHMRRRQMSHNLHMLPAYLRKRARYEYSQTILKRKRRKLKRWKWNKMVLQQERDRDPIQNLFTENSPFMEYFLSQVLNNEPHIETLDIIEKWDRLKEYMESFSHVSIQNKNNPLGISNESIQNIQNAQSMEDMEHKENVDKVECVDIMENIETVEYIATQVNQVTKESMKSIEETHSKDKMEALIQKVDEKPPPQYTGAKRLIAHLYHAKRSHMKEIWGNLIPWKSHQKLYRVTNHFYKNHCTISDNSYYVALQLNGELKDIIDTLAFFIIDIQKLDTSQFQCGNKRIRVPMMDPVLDIPYGDVDILFSSIETSNEISKSLCEGHDARESNGENEDDEIDINTITFSTNANNESMKVGKRDKKDNSLCRSCMIWIHPAALPHAYYSFKEESERRGVFLQYRNDLCRFILRGPHVSTVLCRNNILSVPASHNDLKKLEFWERLKRKELSPPNDFILALKIRHPLCPDQAPSIEELDGIDNQERYSPQHITQKSIWLCSDNTYTAESERLWVKDYFKKFDTNYDAATHSNKSADKMQRNRMAILKGEKSSNGGNLWSTTLFDIILMKYKDDSSIFGSGWDIICPREVGASLMHKLGNTHHVLLVPTMDQIRMETEQALPVFPFDYPDTYSFYTLQDDVLQDCVYKKKLVNRNWADIYRECGVTKEHTLEFNRAKKFQKEVTKEVKFSFTMVKVNFEFGGTPIRKGRLLLPLDESQLESILLNPHQSVYYDSNMKCAGFITSAIQSLQRGHGFALGYINDEYAQVLNETQFTILLHWDSENSPFHVYPVKCTLAKIGIPPPK